MHKQAKLKYEFNALEPYIDSKTMQVHYEKHHGGYVNKLNAALENVPDKYKDLEISQILASLDELPSEIKTKVRQNGGGHANHSLFWEILIPPRDFAPPTEEFKQKLENKFGSFEKFMAEFSDAASSIFGSGWSNCKL